MDALIVLSYLSVVLLLGILCSIISHKLRISNVLLLIIVGIVLNKIQYNGTRLIQFPAVFLTSMGIFALVMIVFDAASRFKLRDFDKLSSSTIKLSIIFLILNLIFLTLFSKIIFSIPSAFLALLFASLMSGTDPAAVISMFGNVKSKVVEILKLESLLNTPLIVLLPFIILDLLGSIKTKVSMTNFIDQIMPFLQQFVVGIGAGILVGIIILKVMKRSYSEFLSPLAIITAALFTYILAENLKGNGVLAVTTMGLFFGNIYVKEKAELIEFSSIFANFLEIVVFILVGLIIEFPMTFSFISKSLLLFAILLIIRLVSVFFSFKDSGLSFKQKMFMTLNVQKGIAVAAIAFTLTTYAIKHITINEGIEVVGSVAFTALPGAMTVLHLTLAFMLYSIILSTAVIKLSHYFIHTEIKEADKVK